MTHLKVLIFNISIKLIIYYFILFNLLITERSLLLLNEFKTTTDNSAMAISNLRWRPKTLEAILLTATATGHLTLWDILHSKNLKFLYLINLTFLSQ